VASFCAKCGSALSPNEQLCSSCGAAASTGGAVAAFVPPAAAPPQSGGSALKIILIIVAVVVGLGIIGIGTIGFIGYRIAKNMHVDPSGKMTMSIPGGTVTTTPSDNLTTSDLGVDVYPGAQSIHGGMKMEMPTASMATGVFLTSDSLSQVLDFYKNKLGGAVSVIQKSDRAVVSLNVDQHESIIVTITTSALRDNGKTKITILHRKSTKAF
jgi:hypothetical protein